jgi:hypothetical protein
MLNTQAALSWINIMRKRKWQGPGSKETIKKCLLAVISDDEDACGEGTSK